LILPDGMLVVSGDALVTTDGLVTFSGVRVGNGRTLDSTPVASSPPRRSISDH